MRRRIRGHRNFVFAKIHRGPRFQNPRVGIELSDLAWLRIALPPKHHLLQQNKNEPVRTENDDEVRAADGEVQAFLRVVGKRREGVGVQRVYHVERTADSRDAPHDDSCVQASGVEPRVALAASLEKHLRVQGDVRRFDDHEPGENEAADGARKHEQKCHVRSRGEDVMGEERLPQRHLEAVRQETVGDEVAARDGEGNLHQLVREDVFRNVFGLHAVRVEFGRGEVVEKHGNDNQGMNGRADASDRIRLDWLVHWGEVNVPVFLKKLPGTEKNSCENDGRCY